MENAKTTFGRRLRLIRKSRGLTLEELGKEASVGYKHIAEIERGQKVPSFEAIDRLAHALGVRPFEFFLPLGAEQEDIDEALRHLTKAMDKHSSPAVKRFVLVLLALVRQLEMDLPEKLKGAVVESIESGKLLGPVTIIGDFVSESRG
jgi:transcriptional regulator with XRE-family HTH domain